MTPSAPTRRSSDLSERQHRPQADQNEHSLSSLVRQEAAPDSALGGSPNPSAEVTRSMGRSDGADCGLDSVQPIRDPRRQHLAKRSLWSRSVPCHPPAFP